jgi:hypothetical protein
MRKIISCPFSEYLRAMFHADVMSDSALLQGYFLLASFYLCIGAQRSCNLLSIATRNILRDDLYLATS